MFFSLVCIRVIRGLNCRIYGRGTVRDDRRPATTASISARPLAWTARTKRCPAAWAASTPRGPRPLVRQVTIGAKIIGQSLVKGLSILRVFHENELGLAILSGES